jgi:hypothetical protein
MTHFVYGLDLVDLEIILGVVAIVTFVAYCG